MSMANSLEVRCPFLDQELLAFSATITSNMKLRGLTTKYILKEAMRGLVPDKIRGRKKHGFGVPVGRWFRTDLKGHVRDMLLSPQARRSNGNASTFSGSVSSDCRSFNAYPKLGARSFAIRSWRIRDGSKPT